MNNWTGQTVVVICAGPSLIDDQLAVVQQSKAKTIGVNTAYLYCKPDALYSGDFLFWKVHCQRIRKACPDSQLWTLDASAAERFRLNRVRGGNREGLGTTVVHMNGNSGFQAINLAFLWGARRILLLGMTMREIDGRKHRHGDHEKPLVQKQLFNEWLHKGVKFAADLKAHGCEVINCDPLSAMTLFPTGDIGKEMA